MNASALKVDGKGAEFPSRIGQVAFGQPRDYDTAALDANIQSVESDGGRAQTIVSLIEGVQNSRVGRVIEALGAEKKIKGPKGLSSGSEPGIVKSQAFAGTRRVRGRNRLSGPRPGGELFVTKSCGLQSQESIPSLRRICRRSREPSV
jgi:hypothetical protein